MRLIEEFRLQEGSGVVELCCIIMDFTIMQVYDPDSLL